ncbi:proton-coupled zinc antiporter SLC30A1-like [Ptychodera flava]|uniref:proton-coupled zinc antiporter SLC30A1-like n=1 Tax=Ptychodera flava TaxID=63121 RepID=UPI003969EB98
MGRYSGKTCRLSSMLFMTSTFFLVEIIVGYITNSMALVADSFHMLSDIVSLLVGFFAVRISKKHTSKNTFGWIRAEVLGALINSVFLVALCFSILVESAKRLVDVEEIENPRLILIVGSIGLLVNLVGLGLFHQHGHSHGGGGHGHSHGGGGHGHSHGGGGHGHSHGGHSKGHSHKAGKHGHSHESKKFHGQPLDQSDSSGMQEKSAMVMHDSPNGGFSDVVIVGAEMSDESDDDYAKAQKLASGAQLNMRGVFLHVLGDALGSVIVIISALVIWFVEGHWKYYVDPAMSIVMVCIILSTTIPLLKESGMILLQTVPTHIKVEDIQTKLISKVNGVLAVHEFHVWRLAGNKIIASAHIRCRNLTDYMKIAGQVKEFFHNEGIHSTTIQPEFEEEDAGEADCMLECAPDKCAEQMCCSSKKPGMTVRERSSKDSRTASEDSDESLQLVASDSANNGRITPPCNSTESTI